LANPALEEGLVSKASYCLFLWDPVSSRCSEKQYGIELASGQLTNCANLVRLYNLSNF
jgi:hypothetical protein